ncbi:substrate-binding protein [Planctomycetota bacterium]
MKKLIAFVLVAIVLTTAVATAESVKIGLNYPKSGPYSVQGLDQWHAAEMATEEINAAGGIMGKQVEIIWRDSQSKKDVTTANVKELIDEGAQMVFGGSSSAVAIAAGKVCEQSNIPFFGTLTYSNATTGTEARWNVFRECYSAWMGAKAIGSYLQENYPGKKYFYITADYTWGHTTEASVRKFTNTEDTGTHKGTKTPFPGAKPEDFKKAIKFAKMIKPDVLVLVLFGADMVEGIRTATAEGLKNEMQIVVPNLTLGMAEGGGPKVMEGVVGALPWCWQVPYKYGHERGKKFVEDYVARYNRYPSTSGASAYTILYEYKAAVERAQSFDGGAVVKSLENHEYELLKGKQQWRDFDHQSVQDVFAVKCKSSADVQKDKFKLDYFEIISSLSGDQAVPSLDEWTEVRVAAGKPAQIERPVAAGL